MSGAVYGHSRRLAGGGLLAVFCLASGLALGPAANAREAPPPEVRTTGLAPGLYMLEGRGGNLVLSIGDDGAFLVDDQYAPMTDAIVAAVAELTDQPVRFVINTHWHTDHTGGNENFGRAGAIVVAHENVRTRMSSEQFVEAFDRSVPPSPEGALPVVTFSDVVTFHWNGEEIRAFHTPPAHTDGDAIVRFIRADVVHMGDVFWNSMYPLVDLSSGGSIDGIIETVQRMLEITNAGTRFVPGHGPVGGRRELVAYLEMLMATRGAIGAMVEAGASLEEVQAARPTAAFDAAWNDGFYKAEQYVGYVYDSLKRR